MAIEQGDFLALAERWRDEGREFDAILMNPPFERVAGIGPQDAEHVMRACELLKPGGRLVAILGEGAFCRQSQAEEQFGNWLEARGAPFQVGPPAL